MALSDYTEEELQARYEDELEHEAWREARAREAFEAAVDLLQLSREANLNHKYVLQQAVESLGLDKPGRPGATKRRTIGRAVTRQVWDRDGWECRACGTHRDLTIDHITPLSKGGTDEISNLQTLCARCNSSKGARA